MTLDDARLYGFYALVHLLESITESEVLGTDAAPRQERVRLGCHRDLGHPSSDIASVEEVDSLWGKRVQIRTHFMGLYGVSSPLATSYLVEVAEDGNEVQRDFLDIINHRLHSLLYRGWRRLSLLSARDVQAGGQYARWLLALAGYEPAQFDENGPVDLAFALRWAGLLSQHPRNAENLSAILRSEVHPQIVVEVCAKRLVRLDNSHLIRLGEERLRLGVSFLIGRHLSDRSGMFSVWAGPLDFEEALSFQPGSDCFERLTAIIDFYLQDHLDFEVIAAVPRERLPGTRLGSRGRGARLRRTSWLGKPRQDFVCLRTTSPRRGEARVHSFQTDDVYEPLRHLTSAGA